MRKLIDWLEHRTGIESAVKSFLYEDIPASSGWFQILGSMAIFFFLIQAATGALLAFNYAPTPGDAYNSVRYIMTELTGGRLIRGLHHWGATMMIIVVVLHMLQVFLFGAYKKPREATWMMGVILLLITLAFGPHGISSALGQSRILGNRRDHADRRGRARGGSVSGAIAGRRGNRRRHLRAFLCRARRPVAAHHFNDDRHPRLPGA